MKYFLLIITAIITNFTSLAQVNYVVKDSLTLEIIPFVNVYLENSKTSLISSEIGAFLVSKIDVNSKITISALGYQKKEVFAQFSGDIFLKPVTYELQEVSVSNDIKEKTLEIGLTNDRYLQTFENGAKLEVKYFPFYTKYKKTKTIKRVTVHTDNKLEKATFKIHFYTPDANGLPGKEMLDRDCIVTVKNSSRKTTFNVLYLNLEIPPNGIFVAFEKLLIDSNKFDKKNENGTVQKILFQPNVFYNTVESNAQYSFSNGKWNKKRNVDNATFIFNEPAIYLTLTN